MKYFIATGLTLLGVWLFIMAGIVTAAYNCMFGTLCV